MEEKLRENDRKKPHWRSLDTEELLSNLIRELAELVEAITYSDFNDIRHEAADVANYAMMIADGFEHLISPSGMLSLRIEEIRR